MSRIKAHLLHSVNTPLNDQYRTASSAIRTSVFLSISSLCFLYHCLCISIRLPDSRLVLSCTSFVDSSDSCHEWCLLHTHLLSVFLFLTAYPHFGQHGIVFVFTVTMYGFSSRTIPAAKDLAWGVLILFQPCCKTIGPSSHPQVAHLLSMISTRRFFQYAVPHGTGESTSILNNSETGVSPATTISLNKMESWYDLISVIATSLSH